MMKRQLWMTVLCLLIGFRPAPAGTLAHGPVILVQPSTLELGPVGLKKSATNSFVVANVGTGTLNGSVTVVPPFKIIAGETYSLKRNETQAVTVVYIPGKALTNVATVKFTGDDNVNATVIGRVSTNAPRGRLRKP